MLWATEKAPPTLELGRVWAHHPLRLPLHPNPKQAPTLQPTAVGNVGGGQLLADATLGAHDEALSPARSLIRAQASTLTLTLFPLFPAGDSRPLIFTSICARVLSESTDSESA